MPGTILLTMLRDLQSAICNPSICTISDPAICNRAIGNPLGPEAGVAQANSSGMGVPLRTMAIGRPEEVLYSLRTSMPRAW